jgi:hypothetical protein
LPHACSCVDSTLGIIVIGQPGFLSSPTHRLPIRLSSVDQGRPHAWLTWTPRGWTEFTPVCLSSARPAPCMCGAADQLCSWGWHWRFYYIWFSWSSINHMYILCSSLARKVMCFLAFVAMCFSTPLCFDMWHCWLILLYAQVWRGNGTAFRERGRWLKGWRGVAIGF